MDALQAALLLEEQVARDCVGAVDIEKLRLPCFVLGQLLVDVLAPCTVGFFCSVELRQGDRFEPLQLLRVQADRFVTLMDSLLDLGHRNRLLLTGCVGMLAARAGEVVADFPPLERARWAGIRRFVATNTETVERYLEGFRTGDHEQILSCLTDDIEWTDVGAFHLVGKEAYSRAIDGGPEFDGPPNLEVVRMVEQEDVVMAELAGSARRTDGNAPPTGT